MTTSLALSHEEMIQLGELVGAAVDNVSRGLTEMFGEDIGVTALHIRTVPLVEVGGLLGDPEMEVVGIFLLAEGDMPGQLLLVMQIATAHSLCDSLLEQPEGTTTVLGEMEISALSEVGNIVGSFFLSALADRGGLRLQVTPPGLMCDMAGAAINLALAEIAMYADEVVVIDADFEHRGRQLPAWFLAFPRDPAHLRLMLGGGGSAW